MLFVKFKGLASASLFYVYTCRKRISENKCSKTFFCQKFTVYLQYNKQLKDMSTLIYLIDKDNREMLGSDGVMRVDGRYTLETIKSCVRRRNIQYSKNFPHKIAKGFIFKGKKVLI